MTFPDDTFEEELDPDEEKPYVFRCTLKPGERIVSATSDIVDSFAQNVDTDSKVSIALRNFGQFTGVKWGVTAYLFMSSDDIGCCEMAWIRFRLTIDATPPLPLPRKIDQTWGIKIKQR